MMVNIIKFVFTLCPDRKKYPSNVSQKQIGMIDKFCTDSQKSMKCVQKNEIRKCLRDIGLQG